MGATFSNEDNARLNQSDPAIIAKMLVKFDHEEMYLYHLLREELNRLINSIISKQIDFNFAGIVSLIFKDYIQNFS